LDENAVRDRFLEASSLNEPDVVRLKNQIFVSLNSQMFCKAAEEIRKSNMMNDDKE